MFTACRRRRPRRFFSSSLLKIANVTCRLKQTKLNLSVTWSDSDNTMTVLATCFSVRRENCYTYPCWMNPWRFKWRSCRSLMFSESTWRLGVISKRQIGCRPLFIRFGLDWTETAKRPIFTTSVNDIKVVLDFQTEVGIISKKVLSFCVVATALAKTNSITSQKNKTSIFLSFKAAVAIWCFSLSAWY